MYFLNWNMVFLEGGKDRGGGFYQAPIVRISKENEALASMIGGYPKAPFKKGIKRGSGQVKWI